MKGLCETLFLIWFIVFAVKGFFFFYAMSGLLAFAILFLGSPILPLAGLYAMFHQ